MLEQCTSKQERWQGVQQLIQRWLAGRQELIVIYCSLCGMGDFSSDCQKSVKKLQLFCQVLVDYMSAGHFEVYDQLAREAEAFGDNSGLLERLYPELKKITDAALDFNDIYDTAEHSEKALGELRQHLSDLGELLDHRFQLEDDLIEALHASHSGRL